MTRPFWLGLIFLIAVGGLAVAKFNAPSPMAAVPAPAKIIKEIERFVAPTENLTTLGVVVSEQPVPDPALPKTDKVADAKSEPVSIKTIPVLINPPRKSETPKQPFKIVSRHWRDPLAPTLPMDGAAKSKSTKKNKKPPS